MHRPRLCAVIAAAFLAGCYRYAVVVPVGLIVFFLATLEFPASETTP